MGSYSFWSIEFSLVLWERRLMTFRLWGKDFIFSPLIFFKWILESTPHEWLGNYLELRSARGMNLERTRNTRRTYNDLNNSGRIRKSTIKNMNRPDWSFRGSKPKFVKQKITIILVMANLAIIGTDINF